MSSLAGQTFAGYEIISQLGRGGMGLVYKARQPKLDRIAALKILASDLASDPDFVARFKREAAAAANLSHPNIVQVYSAGESEGTHYIAMEFVDGETVKQHIESQGRLDPREAIAITVFVAEALQYGWNKARLIHRDIKPDNIFLSKSGEVKVGDLGLAKTVGGATTNLTQTGTMMGSPHYISPEQARGASDIDFRTDIYSLGCTLYHMLTGRPPYDGPDPLSVITKHVNDPPPAIFKTWPACPVPLALVLGKMIAKRPHERPASYEDLIEQLRAVHAKLKPTVAAAPAPTGGPMKATATPTPAPSPAQPTPKPVVPKVATSRRATAVKPKGGLRALLYAVAGVATVAMIAGAVWWFAGRVIETKVLDLGDGVTMTLSVIPPGKFMLGSTKEEQEWVASKNAKQNKPENEGVEPRKATIKQPFWIGQTEVTVGQWRQFANAKGYVTEAEKKGMPAPQDPQKAMGPTGALDWRNPKPGFTPTDSQAVTWITWNDAVAFCNWLDARERDAGRLPAGWIVRLPTEAEWEYACRAGTQTMFWWGDSPEDGKDRLNSARKDDGFDFIAPVDSFGARGRNRLGLADMLGNAREWCLDEFDAEGAHEQMWVGDPPWHVQRGGCAFRGLSADRCAFREKARRNYRAACTGFRIAVGPEPGAEYAALVAPRGGPAVRKETAAAQQPRQTIDLLALTDAVNDRIMPRGFGKANIWERRGRSLIYVSDGKAGKVAPPVAISARSYEIEVEFERLSGTGHFHLDLPIEDGRIVPIYIDKSGTKLISYREGPTWPTDRLNHGRIIVRLDRGVNGAPDRLTAQLDDQAFADWQGDIAKFTVVPEPYPQFPGQPLTSIFCFSDSYEIRAWQLRVFDGEAKVLRGASPNSYDDAYVTQSAKGEKIPHPLSRKTYDAVLSDGKTAAIPEGMVLVPAGPFTMGSDKNPAAHPPHEVYLNAFLIDKFEVTNAQYLEFVKATQHRMPPKWARNGNKIPAGRENHPVGDVSWEDAKAYCDWCGKRLPTEAEWEKAASWDPTSKTKNRFPWGNEEDKDPALPRANWQVRWTDRGNDQKVWDAFTKTDKFKELMTLGGMTMPVGSFPLGASWYKCRDMAGNVWEWTADWFDRYPGNDSKLNEETEAKCGQTHRAVRDATCGCHPLSSPMLSCAGRSPQSPSWRVWHLGFRCAMDWPLKASPAATGPTAFASRKTTTAPAIMPGNLPKETSLDFGGGVKMDLVFVQAGEFMMGSNDGAANARPAHKVRISAPCYMGKYEVTVAQFKRFVAETRYQTEAERFNNGWMPTPNRGWGPVAGVNWKTPVQFTQTDDHPVCVVSWNDIQEFCKWASKQTGRSLRLPTEAQWEYACRAGTTTKFNTTDKDSELGEAAWFAVNSGQRTHPVGQKKPNAWGLYDMHGNLYEMVQDFYSDQYDAEQFVVDPQGSTTGGGRQMRGGGWGNNPASVRSACRKKIGLDEASIGNGFRVVTDALPATGSVASTSSATGDAGWQNAINLLPVIDLQKDAMGGDWTLQDGSLVASEKKVAKIQIPYQPPEEYDLRITFTRLQGDDTVLQVLSKSGTSFVWGMGYRKNSRCCFSTIAGKTGSDDNPTIAKRDVWLENNRQHTSVISVRNDGLKAYLDGELIAQWKTDYRDMGIMDQWKLRNPTLLGLASGRNRIVFHRIEVREVTGKGTFTRGAPAGQTPSATPVAGGDWQNAINLLPLIDPAQDATSGKWEAAPDGLKATDIKSMSQKIQPPYRPPEEYDYRVSFTPISGNADVAIGLTAKGRSFVFYMKKYAKDHCLGFEAISGKNIAGGPTAHRFPHLEMGSRYTVVVEVRKNGLRGYLDGKLVAEWATDYSDMTAWPVWRFKDDTLPGFGCSVSTVVFQEVKLREVGGKGTFTRTPPPSSTTPQK